MLFYPVYKQLRDLIKEAIPGMTVFYYTGQYDKGPGTSLVSPAVYLEFPADNRIDFYPGKKMTTKGVEIQVHYISPAPFQQHDNNVQEAALQQHDDTLRLLDKTINGWNAKDTAGRNLSEAFVTSGMELMKFMEGKVVSILKYTTDVNSLHLL